MHNAPDTIYLQVDPEGEETSAAHSVAEAATWCADRINTSDVEYVRADIAASLRQQIATLQDQVLAIEASKQAVLNEAGRAYADALHWSRREIHLDMGETVCFPEKVHVQLRKLEEILLPENLGERSYFERGTGKRRG